MRKEGGWILAMVFRRFQRVLTGIEITARVFKAVQVIKEGKGWKLLGYVSLPFPEDTIKLSYKTANINDPEEFLKIVKEGMETLAFKVSRVGLSIPSEVVNVSVQKFLELPSKSRDIEKMIAWWARKSLPFLVEKAKIAYCPLAPSQRTGKELLVAIGFLDVLREYELNLNELKISAEVVRPASINLFNFYSERIPAKGVVAFLGLLENYFALLVFEDSKLLFYHGVRRGFSDIHFFQDVEMTLHLYHTENPKNPIDVLYFVTQAGFRRQLEEGLKSFEDIRVFYVDPEQIIIPDPSLIKAGKKVDLGKYASAVGAAQSLMD